MKLTTINQPAFNQLVQENSTFKLIDPSFQTTLNSALIEQTIDLRSVTDTRVGSEFLRYLFKKEGVSPEPYYDDLLTFLTLIAALNHRFNINQADLLALTQVNLPVENWSTKVFSAWRQTTFKSLYQQLDENGDYKDVLTLKFENQTINQTDRQKTNQIVTWSKAQLTELQNSRLQALNNPQLNTSLTPQLVSTYYDQTVDLISRRLKFQILGFEIALKSS